MTGKRLTLRIKTISYEADGILSLDLRGADGEPLPLFAAGAHIDLHLSDDIVRSYSLINPEHERHRYVIAVQREKKGRGGSRLVHELLRSGAFVSVSPPHNNFRLAEDAPHSLLIAGGIGITPIWCMVQRLEALNRSWELHYCARTHERAAFLEPLMALEASRPGRIHLNFDHEPDGALLDLSSVVARAARATHLYCCGPTPMLDAFERATEAWPAEQVHVEYFSATEAPATDGGFTVVLARSGRTILVRPGTTILDTLLENGIAAAHSCREGVCGTCETHILEGEPDHRDLVLTKAEQASNRTMMICCSGSKGARLVLDL